MELAARSSDACACSAAAAQLVSRQYGREQDPARRDQHQKPQQHSHDSRHCLDFHVQPACQFVKRANRQKFAFSLGIVLTLTMTAVSWLTHDCVVGYGAW